MLIDAKETLELATMLRIKLSDADAQRLSGDMSSVLDYVRLLDELDVSHVDPMGVGAGGYAELRDDVPGESLPLEDLETLSAGAFDMQLQAFVTKPIFS
ncbi:MAG: aspartyl/glutamyl-tRNA amidotransferase subunit C [Planctomycetes bacterium]|nr:aspartyl/glutamyl-tRNA amidotransferase subunit C [Planctomycetota bacterium]